MNSFFEFKMVWRQFLVYNRNPFTNQTVCAWCIEAVHDIIMRHQNSKSNDNFIWKKICLIIVIDVC